MVVSSVTRVAPMQCARCTPPSAFSTRAQRGGVDLVRKMAGRGMVELGARCMGVGDTVYHKRWQYICDHNSGKSRSIYIFLHCCKQEEILAHMNKIPTSFLTHFNDCDHSYVTYC